MSVPVDVYDVVFGPAPTVIVPPDRTPRSDSGVLSESDAVPVAVAGTGDDPEEDDDEVPELLDEEEPVLPFRSFSMPAVSWELVRFSAVWLAMLARPLPSLVSAADIALMTKSVADIVLLFWFCCQKVWSCCQKEVLLPIPPVLIRRSLDAI